LDARVYRGVIMCVVQTMQFKTKGEWNLSRSGLVSLFEGINRINLSSILLI